MPESIVNANAEKAQSQAIALFVSDVHLQPAMPGTTQAFIDFLHRHASKAQQLYLLGDLFEYWAGDDDIVSPYNQRIAEAIKAVSDAGVAVFWLGGNRDFLIGESFAGATGITLLSEPFITEIAGHRIVLAHGDAQCTDDLGYMAFRAQVRDKAWQRNFLAMPLTQRKEIIDRMRMGSREAQRGKSYEIMDVNPSAIASLFALTEATVMIHGHTHRPAVHQHEWNGRQCVRHVLPDWDCDLEPARGGWLALRDDGTFTRINFDGSAFKQDCNGA